MPQVLIKQQPEMHAQFAAGQTKSSAAGAGAKVTKVRRQRQSRNPQLSVARRNERERNRVKMVNNGFALLRDHLPAEYLQQTQEFGCQSGGETPDLSAGSGAKSPACSSSAGANSKAKKFSKVETLRAAIQHIRMLEELIRESEPGFESASIPQLEDEQMHRHLGQHLNQSSHQLQQEDGPLSCGSSGSLGTATNSSCFELSASASASPSSLSLALARPLAQPPMHHQIRHQIQPVYDQANASQTEQFVKLEPQLNFAQQRQQPASPMQTAGTTITTTATATAVTSANPIHYSQAPIMTQVHRNLNPNPSLSDNQLLQQQQQTIETSEHTQLWIQQHQSSFMEQQMQMHYNDNLDNQTQAWSPYQSQQQQQQIVQHSPSMAYIATHSQQQQQPLTQMTMAASQIDLSSPASCHWFAPSPPTSTGQQQQPQQQLPTSAFNQQQHHQISLYS